MRRGLLDRLLQTWAEADFPQVGKGSLEAITYSANQKSNKIVVAGRQSTATWAPLGGAQSKNEIAERVERFAKRLEERLSGISNLKFEISDGFSAVGGGAAPAAGLETKLLALSHQKKRAPRLEQLLRNSEPPVISRLVDDRVMIDLRTIREVEEEELLGVILRIAT